MGIIDNVKRPLVVVTAEGEGVATAIYLIEIRDNTEHLLYTGQFLTTKNYPIQMSVVWWLRNPALCLHL
jgi:hypothetical protein